MKKTILYFMFCVLSLQHFAQETTISLPELNLADQYYFDNWIYGADTFFVIPVQLNQHTPFIGFDFNISYNPNIVEPVTENLIDINSDNYIMVANYMGFASFSMINDGNLNLDVFSVSSNENMLSVSFLSFMEDSATTTLYNSCNGNLMYLAFKKISPCYDEPIFINFWNGDLGEGNFINTNQTAAFSMQAQELVSTEQNTAYSVNGEVILNLLDVEVIQNGNLLEAFISGGSPPYSYQWQDKAENLLNNNSYFSPLVSGDYIFTVIDINGCSYISYASFEEGLSTSWNCVNNDCTDPGDGSGEYQSYSLCVESCEVISGLQNIEKEGIVYPNPAQTYIEINYSGLYQYQLIDMKGKTVRKGLGNTHTIIDRNQLPAGLYLLSIIGNETWSKKIIFE